MEIPDSKLTAIQGFLISCGIFTAQATIEKWMADGDTKEEAIDRWQQITYTRLPEIIKNLIKES